MGRSKMHGMGVLIRKPERKTPLGRPRLRWKIDFTEIE
jgi:hypothetical protein